MKKNGLRLLSVALALVLLIGLLPAAALAAAADHKHDGWTKWSTANALPTTAGDYMLSANVLLSQSWVVPKGTTRLCLEGHSIIYGGSAGCVIQIPAGAALELYDLDGNVGLITGGKGNASVAEYLGGGVSVKGSFTMNGGKITGNNASTGGGVYVASSGSFTMNGGVITGNNVGLHGGGVTVAGKLYVSGNATVNGNTKDSVPSNVRLEAGKTIQVTDKISGTFGVSTSSEPSADDPVTITTGLSGKGTTANFVSDNGRCLISTTSNGNAALQRIDSSAFRYTAWNSPSALPNLAGDYSLYDNVALTKTWVAPMGKTRLCLEGRTISLSAASGCVIEVPANATLEIYDKTGGGGVITGGKGTNGGGVYVLGSLIVYAGTISGNSATNGGGVYVDTDASFRLAGGAITNNTAKTAGGGVYTQGVFSVANMPTVTGNSKNGGANNVFLPAGKTISIFSAFSGSIGVSTATVPADGKSVKLTADLMSRGAASSFTSDDYRYLVNPSTDGEAILVVNPNPVAPTPTPSASPAPSASPSPSESPKPTETPTLKFSSWSSADAMPTEAGDYSLAGNVTLKEGWTVPQGVTRLSLEGHTLALNAEYGSVINVPAGATLEIYDVAGNTGAITGGKGRASSGFYLGGGIYVAGDCTLYGGRVTGNSATSGGGIYVDTTGKAHLAGGKVTGNTVTVGGGGVFARGDLSVSGGVSVTGNTRGSDGDNVRLAAGKTIAVAGKLSGAIGVSTAAAPTDSAPVVFTSGLSGKGAAANFTSDDKSYAVSLSAAGEAVLTLAPTQAQTIVYTDWSTANALPTTAGNFKLTCDVLLKESWSAPKGTTRLNLNGHTIALNATSGSVLQVPGDAVLELYDLENNSGVITKGKGRVESGYNLGGGVFVRGTLNMYGGRIMGNSATTGGGVYTDTEGVFRMFGGKITGNTVTVGGGGVFARGAVEVSGAVNVTGNTKKDGGADNLRLAANVDLKVTGPLSGSIGINKAMVPEEGSPVSLTAGLGGHGDAAIFSSDDKTYTIILNTDGEVLLSVYCPKDKTCPISAYTDMKPTDWYHDGVHFVLESGFMNGYGNKLFGPGDPTTRAMAATIIWNMAGKPKSEGKMTFTDVKADQWYSTAVRWAAEVGVITGYTDGITGELIFRPEDNVTREQLATMIYRYAQYRKIDVSVGADTNVRSYDDSFSIGVWAKEAMQWAVGSGLMSGRTASTLDPKANATRAEVATVIMRYSTKVAK